MGALPVELNGGPTQNLGAQVQHHDTIEFRLKTKEGIIAQCAPLYEKGLSLREIAALTGVPKTTIRETLTRSGRALRNFESGRNVPSERRQAKRPGHAPFGYGYLEGVLVKDPKEYTVVKRIMQLWQSGKSPNAIAQELNASKTPTRLAGIWRGGGIRAIVKREQSLNSKAKTKRS